MNPTQRRVTTVCTCICVSNRARTALRRIQTVASWGRGDWSHGRAKVAIENVKQAVSNLNTTPARRYHSPINISADALEAVLFSAEAPESDAFKAGYITNSTLC